MDFDGALNTRVGGGGGGALFQPLLFHGGPVTKHSGPGPYALPCFDLLHNLRAISRTPH